MCAKKGSEARKQSMQKKCFLQKKKLPPLSFFLNGIETPFRWKEHLFFQTVKRAEKMWWES